MYKRKTKDVWILEGNFGYGWEEMIEYNNRKEAYDDLKSYIDNDKKYDYRIRVTREKIEGVDKK